MINLAVLRLKLLVCIITPVFSTITKLWNPSCPNLDRLSGSTTNEPDASNRDDADICPAELKIIFSFSEFILDSDIWNPPILPSAASIVPAMRTSPSGFKWNLLELISIIPPEALINWELSEPTKNASVLISNTDGLDLNLRKLSELPNSSKPTPL